MNKTAVALAAFALLAPGAFGDAPAVRLVPADDPAIRYTGRVDFSNPKKPRFWAPGVTIQAKFRGTSCDAVIGDQVLWGHSHNYLEIAVDDMPPFRVQTTGTENTIKIASSLPEGTHTVTICKDTEAGIGYLEFEGFQCAGLVRLPRQSKRKIEFIGDSITCGAGSDLSQIPCGKGEWYDQHNAYMSYGPTAARRLNAQWQVTSVSGIGMMHSCCDMKTTMPDVFDTIDLQSPGRLWEFSRYQPDIVTVCLGQNDGQQEIASFCDRYTAFVKHLRTCYPKARIVCLTSPMADAKLTEYMKTALTTIVNTAQAAGDKKVSSYFFSRSYNSGCGGHPDLEEQGRIGDELSQYLSGLMHWKL